MRGRRPSSASTSSKICFARWDLPARLETYLARYRDTRYRDGFAWVDLIAEVKSNVTVRAGAEPGRQLAPDDHRSVRGDDLDAVLRRHLLPQRARSRETDADIVEAATAHDKTMHGNAHTPLTADRPLSLPHTLPAFRRLPAAPHFCSLSPKPANDLP